VTAQGHPRAIFKRAIESGNLVIAAATAYEVGRLSLEGALRLVFLYAEQDPVKFERAALRWVSRYVIDGKAVSLLKVQLALSALAELRSWGERSRREDAHGDGATLRRASTDEFLWCEQSLG
jgi:hypothetical protein